MNFPYLMFNKCSKQINIKVNNTMKHVHWIGTGLSSLPGIRRLAKNLENLTIWNRTLEKAQKSINHINKFGSSHSDCIVTEDQAKAELFLSKVDSSSVMHNVPTCWADGYEYGLGAEVGISTDKFHARGPVGLEGLTSQKYLVKGQGELRGK